MCECNQTRGIRPKILAGSTQQRAPKLAWSPGHSSRLRGAPTVAAWEGRRLAASGARPAVLECKLTRPCLGESSQGRAASVSARFLAVWLPAEAELCFS